MIRGYNTGDFDFFYLAADAARDRFHQLPRPLPWVEPSINMPHLDACASYVFRQDLGCVLVTAVLLEHVLRLAVIDQKGGTQGSMSKRLWKKYSQYSIGDLFQEESALLKTLVAKDDILWWRDFAAKVVRNKMTHLDVPIMIKHLFRKEEYVGSYKQTDDDELIFASRRSWGAVFHKSDSLVALGFLRDATEKMRALVARMAWQPDRSHWASQEWEYNAFFQYPWTLDAMVESLQRGPRDVAIANPRGPVASPVIQSDE